MIPDKDDEESVITINSADLEQRNQRAPTSNQSLSKTLSQLSNTKPIVIDEDVEFADDFNKSPGATKSTKF